MLDTATPDDERQIRRLRGIIPAAVETIELQMERALEQLRRRSEPIDKYIFLSNIRNTNIRLFYSLLLDHLEVRFSMLWHKCINKYVLIYSFLQ
jgi:malate dehydrogenase (oxaloacetate-decarboxylating)(NADP+)